MTDPTLENQNHNLHREADQYWRESYANRPYYSELQRDIPDIDYDRDLSSAYELGRNARAEYGEKPVLKTLNPIFNANGSSLKQSHG